MKKILFVLVALLFAAPAWAAVDITAAVDPGDKCTVIISFDASGEPNLVRAFSLNIQADNDANIASVALLSADYVIHPGTIVIDTQGEVTDYGSPVAPESDLPSDTLGGIGTGGVTIEMASLYAPVGPGSPNAPAPNGDLVAVTVNADCTLTITANVSRAGSSGVVMESPDEAVTVNLPAPIALSGCGSCYAGQPDEDQWDIVGQPDCWCYQRQCHGDGDGLKEGDDKGGYFYVGAGDLGQLLAGWKVLEPADPPIPSGPGITSVPGGACADYDHVQEGDDKGGYFRVGAGDLGILLANWKILEPADPPIPSGPGIPGDCQPGNEFPD